jgi:para-nitrobenzyl esterase
MGCCAFISTVVCFLAAAPAQPTPTVDVTGGAVRGYMAAPGSVFKAIPFADPPIAGLRWREPQPVKPWRGVRDASRYSPACMQNPALRRNSWKCLIYGRSEKLGVLG